MDELRQKLQKIKLLAMDFDGILTDGCVYVDQNGIETVRCSHRDGLGIDLLKKNGIQVVVISKQTNPVVSARCRKMQIDCFQKISDGSGKLDILKKVLEEKQLNREEVIFMGDDVNDLAALDYAGVAVTVADGRPQVKKICDYITQAAGGQHAVRELCDMILEARGATLEF